MRALPVRIRCQEYEIGTMLVEFDICRMHTHTQNHVDITLLLCIPMDGNVCRRTLFVKHTLIKVCPYRAFNIRKEKIKNPFGVINLCHYALVAVFSRRISNQFKSP